MRSQVIFLQALKKSFLVPLDMISECKNNVKQHIPRVPACVVVQCQDSTSVLLKQIPPIIILSHMDGGIMHLSERTKSTLTERLMCLEAFNEVTSKCHLITLFNLLQASLNGLLRVHEKEGFDSKINHMPMTSNPLLSRILFNTFGPQMFGEKTTQFVVGTVVVTSVESDLLPDVIIFQDTTEEFPLFSCTVAPGTLVRY